MTVLLNECMGSIELYFENQSICRVVLHHMLNYGKVREKSVITTWQRAALFMVIIQSILASKNF